MKAALQGHEFEPKSDTEIRRDVQAIQSSWTNRERQKRAVMGLARQLELLQMCGLLPSFNSPSSRFGAAV